MHLTECSYHVTYAFQSESALYDCLDVKELLAQNRRDTWILNNGNGTSSKSHLARKQTLNHLAKLANNSAVLWVLICTMHLTVCSYHAMYAFQREFTLYNCLNVKELLAWNRHDIWNLSDCNGTWIATKKYLWNRPRKGSFVSISDKNIEKYIKLAKIPINNIVK